jgi:hypothetical protein
VPLGCGLASPRARTARIGAAVGVSLPFPDWATDVFRDAVAPGRRGPPEPAVWLTVAKTRRSGVEPLMASRVLSPAGRPVGPESPLRLGGAWPACGCGLVDRELTAAAPDRAAGDEPRPPPAGRPVVSESPLCQSVDCGRGPTPRARLPCSSRLNGGDSLFKYV